MTCWEASLAAFNIKVNNEERGQSITWVIDQLLAAGWVAERVDVSTMVADATPTLAAVIPRLRGNWLLVLNKNVIASQSGIITDTSGHQQTVKRQVRMAYRLTARKLMRVTGNCDCADPVVFGHGYEVGPSGNLQLFCPSIKAAIRAE